MPRMDANDAGILSFPVPPAQLQALIAMADRAPYGRGEETIVDRSVRDCLQIATDRIELGSRTWDDTLDGILDRAAEGLGCPRGSVTAALYKLLIYEPGGFFAPHRDTEKADGMVATLVVALPVLGRGGGIRGTAAAGGRTDAGRAARSRAAGRAAADRGHRQRGRDGRAALPPRRADDVAQGGRHARDRAEDGCRITGVGESVAVNATVRTRTMSMRER